MLRSQCKQCAKRTGGRTVNDRPTLTNTTDRARRALSAQENREVQACCCFLVLVLSEKFCVKHLDSQFFVPDFFLTNIILECASQCFTCHVSRQFAPQACLNLVRRRGWSALQYSIGVQKACWVLPVIAFFAQCILLGRFLANCAGLRVRAQQADSRLAMQPFSKELCGISLIIMNTGPNAIQVPLSKETCSLQAKH